MTVKLSHSMAPRTRSHTLSGRHVIADADAAGFGPPCGGRRHSFSQIRTNPFQGRVRDGRMRRKGRMEPDMKEGRKVRQEGRI
jgi:hypothetical protein